RIRHASIEVLVPIFFGTRQSAVGEGQDRAGVTFRTPTLIPKEKRAATFLRLGSGKTVEVEPVCIIVCEAEHKRRHGLKLSQGRMTKIHATDAGERPGEVLYHRTVRKVLQVIELTAQAKRRSQGQVQQMGRGSKDLAVFEIVDVLQDQPAAMLQK